MAYHTQMDGQIERINQEVKVVLWHYANYQQDLTIKIKLLKLETFLEELQRSWEMAKLSIEKAKEIKKKFDQKKTKPSGYKVEEVQEY